MAILYVRSTDGDDASDGSTWALAKATLAGAAAIDSAGDTIYVSQVHNEAPGSSQTYTLAGTLAAPTKIICANDGAEPPTAVAATGVISTNGNFSMTLAVTGAYLYGLIFSPGVGTPGSSSDFTIGTPGDVVFEDCNFILPANSGAFIVLSLAGFPQLTKFTNCGFKFSNAAQKFLVVVGQMVFDGGSIVAGSTALTGVLFGDSAARGTHIIVSGMNLENLGSSCDIFTGGAIAANGVFLGIVRNCKLPSSWTGTLFSAALTTMGRAEMYNCDSGDTNYKIWIEDYFGSLIEETTIIKTGGASDGTTGLSWKMVSNANTEFPSQPFCSHEMVKCNETTGSAITVTVDIIHDSVTNVQNDEIWIEVQYLSTSGVPLGSFISDRAADILATPADQTDSSSTWTTTGLTNPNTQQLNVTFTPQEKGYIHAKVCLALASKTVYVDFEPVVT
jgi:hypothetical protein